MSVQFNPGQREAVESRASRIVVSAGAGSGKTRVLVQRFVDRVFEQEAAGDVSPIRSVLLITFTDKAAGELTERVRQAFLNAGRPDLARAVDNAWISTIHGFCARVVRRHALELGVDPAFAVLADPQTGLERTAAFERAASRCLSSTEFPGVAADMVGEGVADLRATVLAGYDRARSKGVPVTELGALYRRGYRWALLDLAETLDRLLPDYRGLRETATVAKNLAGFVRLREDVALAQELSPPEEGIEAVCALGALKGARNGCEETKALTGRINDAIVVAVQAAVDAAAAGRADAWRELLVAFSEEYESGKQRAGALDFEDLQLLTRRLWSERPDIATRLGGQFVEIMVDEFQDTNPLQLQVVTPITQGGQCVVGDVQQSIYRFRDADVALLQDKQRQAEVSAAEQACRLTVNYRSDRTLLAGLNVIFGAPDFFGADYLTLEGGAGRESGVRWPEGTPRIEALIVDKDLCVDEDWRTVEARALAQRLRRIVAEGQASPDDIVVLVRASTKMPVYIAALREAGFDVVASASGGFYATVEYADTRALLRVLANPLDDEGVLGLLAGGFGGLSDDALLALSRRGEERGLWKALEDAPGATLSGTDAQRAALLRETIGRLRALRGRLPLADAILHAASVLGPGGGLLDRAGAWANVRKVVRLASEFESTGASDPAEFLRYLDDRETFIPREPAAGLAVEGSGAVRVMTVHAAKGLEFPVVAVADLGHEANNTYPRFLLATQGDELVAVARGSITVDSLKIAASTPWRDAVEREKELDLQESKRVFYVACTRAEQALVLAGSTKPDGEPRPGIAVDWVLEASRRQGEALVGLLSTSVIGPADVPEGPPLTEATRRPGERTGESVATPRLRDDEPIPPPREVSYTALALYERCAYRFFAERMLRVGSLELPKQEDPLAFGSALHAALELVARGEAMDEDRLRRLAEGHHLPAGSLERLSNAVSGLLASDEGRLLAAGRPEVPFAISVRGGVVRGTMDLVVVEGARATVLDYKTGLTWDESGARYAAQAEIYALALLESGVTSVEVRFVHVEAGCEAVSYTFTPRDRERVLGRVEDAFVSMEAGAFPPLSAYEPTLCADCPVSGNLCAVVHPHAGGGRAR